MDSSYTKGYKKNSDLKLPGSRSHFFSKLNINFADITFEKCNDPEHSHPPLSQRENSEDLEKLVNSYLDNSFLVFGYQNYFDISFKVIFDKPEKFPDFLFTHFPPARGPPHIEV